MARIKLSKNFEILLRVLDGRQLKTYEEMQIARHLGYELIDLIRMGCLGTYPKYK